MVAQRKLYGNSISFFKFIKISLNSIIKLWFDGCCKETPPEMADIIKNGYRGEGIFRDDLGAEGYDENWLIIVKII